jgi:hypothetical protein
MGPRLESIPAHLGDLEPDWSLGLSLHHYRTRVDVILVCDIADAKAR